MKGLLRKRWEQLKAFFFPSFCSLCGTLLPFYRRLICEKCEEFLPRNRPSCPCCARSYAVGVPEHLCGDCLSRRPPARVLAPFRYEPPVSDWLKALKFKEELSLARDLGWLFRREVPCLPEADVIVPVPLGSGRLRSRGFNQSFLLARFIFNRSPRPLLRRKRETPPQTELSIADRKRNVKGAFALREKINLKGQRVVLVDDVFTTGATAWECVRVLMAAGAAEVTVVVIARA